jgi:hypothetical protein
MPIPRTQLIELERNLRSHQDRVKSLRKQAEYIEQETLVHETVLSLGRDPKLVEALNDIYDQKDLVDQNLDLASYFERRGVIFPPETLLKVASSGHPIVLEAYFKQGVFAYKLTWNSDSGFELEQV